MKLPPSRSRRFAAHLGLAIVPRVLDYSAARPDPATMAAAKIVGVCRYICRPTNSFNIAKTVTKAENDRLHAAGIAVTLNFEQEKDRWRHPELGFGDGRVARAMARALGHPDSRPIIQSVDTNWTGGELGTALSYQSEFNRGSGTGPQGMYGTGAMIDAAFAKGLIVVGWQTASRSWTGNANDSPNAALLQRTSKSYPQFPATSYDENDIRKADWGQWPIGGSVPDPPLTVADAVQLWGGIPT